ncbi:hypothetical protein SNE40_018168 [Patella caerulea]|uniref:Reverse transcriptase domain-containing protein n=1 Tax=Patella caerulea TaxID=87958 RepID=A0AAN8J8A4_PATCE
MELRSNSMSYSIHKKRETKSREKILIDKICKLESLSDQNKLKSEELIKLTEHKNDLENIRNDYMKGVVIRSKAQWIEDGEKPSKYFCNLELNNFMNKTIQRVETGNGNTITDQKEILKQVRHFYASLYNDRETELDNYDLNELLKIFNYTILDDTQSNSLEGLISEEELLIVLNKMKLNKSPGSSGFPADFYKHFWGQLKTIILRATNDIYDKGILPIDQRFGVITCIPKGDKPRHLLTNWRPITLLNVFYKLLSGVIANRIKSVLNIIISNSQTGFIKGRYIGENTRLLFDLLHYTENNDIPGLLILIDFEKAFDSVAWSFVYKVLDFFNFCDTIKNWIKIFNNNILSSVIQHGHLSESFNVKRGCRQGDPIAPYIFILCAEILSMLVKNNKLIGGIVIGKTEHVISQYADDTTLFLDGSKQSFHSALDTLDQFASISGLKINSFKTKIVWIGSKKYSNQVYHHDKWKLNWGSTSFSLLGIDFSIELNNIVTLNLDKQLIKIRSSITQWNRRILSPIGRITVIKTLLLPKLILIFISLPNPSINIIKAINTDFFKFIWGSSVDRVKREVLVTTYQYGGLKMTNLNLFIMALKCTWIRRILVNFNTPWLDIVHACYGNNFTKELIDFGDQFLNSKINTTNPFWKDVFTSWSHISLNIINTDLPKSPLWYNSKIKIDKKTYIFQIMVQ